MTCSSMTGGLAVEYNAFLRSPLWLEQTGATLSVLSALARLDIDPWQEAEALASLPGDDASARLSDLLAERRVLVPATAAILSLSVYLVAPRLGTIWQLKSLNRRRKVTPP